VTVPLAAATTSQFQAFEIPLSGSTLGTTYQYRITATSEKGSRVSTGFFDTIQTREDWRLSHFGSADNTGDAADDADSDGDG